MPYWPSFYCLSRAEKGLYLLRKGDKSRCNGKLKRAIKHYRDAKKYNDVEAQKRLDEFLGYDIIDKISSTNSTQSFETIQKVKVNSSRQFQLTGPYFSNYIALSSTSLVLLPSPDNRSEEFANFNIYNVPSTYILIKMYTNSENNDNKKKSINKIISRIIQKFDGDLYRPESVQDLITLATIPDPQILYKIVNQLLKANMSSPTSLEFIAHSLAVAFTSTSARLDLKNTYDPLVCIVGHIQSRLEYTWSVNRCEDMLPLLRSICTLFDAILCLNLLHPDPDSVRFLSSQKTHPLDAVADESANVELSFLARYAVRSLAEIKSIKNTSVDNIRNIRPTDGKTKFATFKLDTQKPGSIYEEIVDTDSFFVTEMDWHQGLVFLDCLLAKENFSGFENFILENKLRSNDNFMQGVCIRLEQVAAIHSANRGNQAYFGAIKFLKDIISTSKDNVQAMAQISLDRLGVTGNSLFTQAKLIDPTHTIHPNDRSTYRMNPVWDRYWQSNTNSVLLKEVQSDMENASSSISMDKVNMKLMDYYSSQLIVGQVSGRTLDLDSCCVNLVTTKAKSQYRRYDQNIREQPEKLIPLQGMFDEQRLPDGRDGMPKKILVTGRPGVGKTTFCKKLVHAFQKGLWNDRFEAVIWLPLRLLKGDESRFIEDLLVDYYFTGESEDTEVLIRSLMRSVSDERVLFLLDGLDEIVCDINPEEESPLRSLLESLLDQPNLIATTGSYNFNRSLLNNLDQEFEIIGFNEGDVERYVNKTLNNHNDAKRAMDFIRQTPLIQRFVNIPVHLDLICYCWDNLVPSDISMTITHLHQTVIQKLQYQDSIRARRDTDGDNLTEDIKVGKPSTEDIDDNVMLTVEYLGYLAFRGLKKPRHQHAFVQDTLLESLQEFYQHKNQANRSEIPPMLLAEVKQSSMLHSTFNRSRETWSFIHSTFQDYFASTLLSSYLENERSSSSAITKMMSKDETISFIQYNKYNPRFENVWLMMAGQLGGKALKSFFRLLQGAPRDLIGVRHHLLLAGCYKEARPRLSTDFVNQIQHQLSKWLLCEISIQISQSNGGNTRSPLHGIPNDYNHTKATMIQQLMQIMNDSDPAIVKLTEMVLDHQLIQSVTTITTSSFLDGNPGFEIGAHSVLENNTTLSKSTATELEDSLQDINPKTREAAAYSLSGHSTLSESSVMALITALKDEESNVRKAAAYAIGNQSKLSGAPIATLINSLQDEEWYVRRVAVNALGGQFKVSESVITALVIALQDNDFYVRRVAANALGGQLSISETTITALVNTLSDEVPLVRGTVANALGEHSTLPDSAITALIITLHDENPLVRGLAVNALGRQSILSDTTVLALIGCLQDMDPDVRRAAANALGKLPSSPELAIAGLVNALQDYDPGVRGAVVNTLSRQCLVYESVFNAFINALNDIDPNVRRLAVISLGKQITLSESTILVLVKLLQDKDSGVRIATAIALGGKFILPESAITALLACLQDNYSGVRRAAIDTLSKQPVLLESTKSAIINALHDKDSSVKKAALYALGKESTLSESLTKALISALQHDRSVIKYLADAIGIQKLCLSMVHLSEYEIEFLKREVLFGYGLSHRLLLYINENRLQFFIEQGYHQSEILDSEVLKRINSAFGRI